MLSCIVKKKRKNKHKTMLSHIKNPVKNKKKEMEGKQPPKHHLGKFGGVQVSCAGGRSH